MLIERVLLFIFHLVVFEKCLKLMQMVDVLSNIGTVTRTFLAVENYDNNKSSTHVHSENMYQCIIYVRHTVKYFLRVFFMVFEAVVPTCKRTAEGFPRFLKIRATVLIILPFLMYIKFHWLLFEVF